MGILELITVALLVLKLTLYPEWSWLLVASPFLVAIAIYVILVVLFFCGAIFTTKNKRK